LHDPVDTIFHCLGQLTPWLWSRHDRFGPAHEMEPTCWRADRRRDQWDTCNVV